jgi:hypothetical protein
VEVRGQTLTILLRIEVKTQVLDLIMVQSLISSTDGRNQIRKTKDFKLTNPTEKCLSLLTSCTEEILVTPMEGYQLHPSKTMRMGETMLKSRRLQD